MAVEQIVPTDPDEHYAALNEVALAAGVEAVGAEIRYLASDIVAIARPLGAAVRAIHALIDAHIERSGREVGLLGIEDLRGRWPIEDINREIAGALKAAGLTEILGPDIGPTAPVVYDLEARWAARSTPEKLTTPRRGNAPEFRLPAHRASDYGAESFVNGVQMNPVVPPIAEGGQRPGRVMAPVVNAKPGSGSVRRDAKDDVL